MNYIHTKKGEEIIVDEATEQLIRYSNLKINDHKVTVDLNGAQYNIYNVIPKLMYMPKRLRVWHINRNRLDYRLENLELLSISDYNARRKEIKLKREQI